MSRVRDFFDRVYKLSDRREAEAHYAEFAPDYEAAMEAGGYVTPGRCAKVLAEHGAATGEPVLDVGCGSGLGAQALKGVGFETIDGTDFSAEMLAQAETKGLYRSLWQADLGDPQPDHGERYDTAMAAGVLNPAHAPATALDNVLEMVTSGGLFAFSLNDHAIADGSYEGRIHALIDGGTAELLMREYGDHMPGENLKAWVYLLRKR